ncbi:acyltransferase [Mucilaginibacter sp. UR6-11]|uniref:acyltransferase family protein n=1 Tax=Mucilaginibacter sp. UR6-11 TaxID=1435644 RepID=UPI001E4D1E8C|nr:acyltransferase [Mucilaginibacter sp. UR6-11]MCC8423798.1 acyltransferase [Mucilaginibacter sp. UR6-11]
MQKDITIKTATERPRVRALDSLRGIAALTVVFNHTLEGLSFDHFLHFTPLYIIKAGHEAVLFFFLLSGYVLTYQYRFNPEYTYRRFLVHRFFRIYVPYIVSILLSLCLFMLCTPKQGGGQWVSNLWSQPPTIKVLIKHVALVWTFNTNALNPVIWSLVHEMRVAIIFPALLYVVNLKPVNTAWVTVSILIISVISIMFNLTYVVGYNDSLGYTAYYFCAFVVGGLISRYQSELVSWNNSLTTFKRTALLVVAWLCFSYSSIWWFILDNPGWPRLIYHTIVSFGGDLLTLAGSVYFMIAAISLKGNNFLTSKIPLFLGKISYSLYLVHVPVLGFIYFTLVDKIPTPVVIGMGVLGSLLTAIIFNKYIEQPAMRIAKKVVITKTGVVPRA